MTIFADESGGEIQDSARKAFRFMMKIHLLNDSNNKFHLVFELLMIMMLVASCKSKDELVYNYYPPTREENIIDEHLSKNNIEALIKDCIKFQDYSTPIANYLLYEIDYTNVDYSLLVHYQDLAKQDSVLYNGYESLIIQKEEKILDYISNLDIDGVADYYKKNPSERSFLRPVLCEAYLTIIDTLQYVDIKKLYKSFSKTDIGDSIAPYYIEMREAIKPVITNSYESYCATEKEIKEYYEEKAKEELDLFISSRMESFIEALFDKDLPRKQEKINEMFTSSFYHGFPTSSLIDIVNNNITELTSVLNAGRIDFIESISEEVGDKSRFTIPHEVNYIKNNFPKTMNISDLYKISEIQNRTDWFGLVLGAASFLTGGWAGLALSALDIHHGVKDVKGKAAEVLPYIQSFVTNVQTYLEDMSSYYVTEGFSLYDRKSRQSSNNFKEVIYEIY